MLSTMSSKPAFSSIRAWFSALSTRHSAVGPPYFSSSSFSALPLFTPMRIGIWWAFAQSASSRTRASPPMFPGLMRSFAMPFSAARIASLWSKWMSATSGTGLPSTSFRTASAHSPSYTLTRTMSHPASASARICFSVASASRVSVFVMLCTRMGFPPPSGSLPMLTVFVMVVTSQWSVFFLVASVQ